jgi:hypothetical protein
LDLFVGKKNTGALDSHLVAGLLCSHCGGLLTGHFDWWSLRSASVRLGDPLCPDGCHLHDSALLRRRLTMNI